MKHYHSSAGLLCLMIFLLLPPATGRSEIYVEGYLGGVQGADSPIAFTTTHAGFRYEINKAPGNFNPAVIGGVKVGTWFVPEGFLGFNYPSWMKYFGFYTDFSFHRLNFSRQQMSILAVSGRHNAVIQGSVSHDFWSEGTVATLAFMFAGRYGFFPTAEIPFGRLQPYVAVGPAVLFTSQDVGIESARFIFPNQRFNPFGVKAGSVSDVTIGLAVETGIRWMALKNVSFDISFKYRYAKPSFTFDYIDEPTSLPKSITLNPAYNLFSGQIGVAYHF